MRWIAIVVIMLLGNVIAVSVLIVKAGGTSSRVLPDYYQRAAAYDDTLAEARASVALGWVASAAIRGDEIELQLGDRARAPVTGATVSVTVDPRGRADRTAIAALVEAEPGVYRGTIARGAPGLYIVTTTAARAAARFTVTATIERAP